MFQSAWRRHTAFINLGLAIVTFCVLSTPLQAQQVNPGTETGMPPYATFSGGSLDHINVQSGVLHVEIPVFSLKERGRTFTWKFVYDPLSYERVWDPEPTPQDAGNGTYIPQSVDDAAGGWRLVGPLGWTLNYLQQSQQTCPATGQTYGSFSQFSLEDPEGTKHQLPLYQDGINCNPAVLSGPALDGSGIVVSFPSEQPDSWTAILKDGTTITHSGTMTDSNGNIVSSAGDMLLRNPVTVTTGQNSTSYTFKDSRGNSETYQLQYASFNVVTTLCGNTNPYPCTEYTTTQLMPIKLLLPDGTSYQFAYRNNSEVALTQMTLPTGGVISYGTALLDSFQPDQGHHPTLFQRSAVTSRTVSGQGTWTYTGNTVTDPAGNQQVFQYAKVSDGTNCSASPVETSESDYQGSASTGKLLKTITKTWTGEPANINNGPDCGFTLENLRVVSETTTLDSGQESQVQTDYETFTYDGSFVATRMNPTERREYDYGSGGVGPLIRKTDYTYLHTNNQTYLNLNIVDRVASVTTYNGSGSKLAQTTNEYDNYTQGITPTTAVQHSSSFGNGYTTRGNLTAVSRWRNTDGALLNTRNQYNDVGEIISTVDPKNNKTSFDYSDAWSNAVCAPAGSAVAYLTKITNALNQVANFSYDSCTGALASSTDVNGQITTSTYGLYDRPVATSYPDGGSMSMCYSDDPNGTCYSSALPLKIITTKAIASGTNPLVTTAVLDSLGRISQNQTNSDPQGVDYADTTYDALGRVATVSNPYRSTSDPTYGLTTYGYDGLGRKTQTTDPDSSVTTTVYSGNSVTVTDEAGNPKRSFLDALGRLIEIDEPGGPPSGPGTFATGSVTISGSERSKSIFPPGCRLKSCAETIYDSGTVSITVNGFTESVSYGQGDAAGGLATELANEFNGAGTSSPVTATVSGGVISLQSSTSGVSTNYTLSARSSTDDPTDFGTPSFSTTTSGSTLTGGTGGSGGVSSLSLNTPFQTLYTYDALGNLLQVQQKGNDANSADWRTRSFTYNSLSQLLTSSNPETGAVPVTYTYDDDGNVATKTDARNITTTYSYDVLNRLTKKQFSDTTPTVYFNYDALTQTGCTAAITDSHPKGYRTGMCDAAGSEAWSHDPMGRVLTDQRTTNGVTKTITYTYNLDGAVTSVTYPDAFPISYTYDSVGRPASAFRPSAANFAKSATYAPQGALSGVLLGVFGSFAGVNVTSSYNKRLQPVEIKASSAAGTEMDLSYCFYAFSGTCPSTGTNDNGNVTAILNNLNSARTQSFSYDALNRLATAQTQGTAGSNCFGFLFSYDAWANLVATDLLGGYGSCTATAPNSFSISVGTNNRITTSGFSYDASGNVSGDGINTYTWNAESETKTAAGVTYTHDGDGNRVEKSNGTLYWYGLGGEVLEETSLTGGVKNDYVYFDGKRIAQHTSSSANFFYLEDHLGSSRVMTDASGNVCYDADFLPFGQEVDYTSTCAQNYKFEGKERDIETGNDNFGARYYRSALGRWQSPDWSAIPEAVPYANLTNPQTLNLYQFVEDDPETYADLDGHQERENGQGNNQSATTTTTTCTDSGGTVNDDGHSSCTTTKVDANHPPASAVAVAEPTLVEEIEKTGQKAMDQIVKPLIEGAAENGAKALPDILEIGTKALAGVGAIAAILDPQRPIASDEDYLNKAKGLPPDAVRLKKGQGYRDKGGNVWKKDKFHKDHWDVIDRKGRKIREVTFDGRQIWPGGPKNKNND